MASTNPMDDLEGQLEEDYQRGAGQQPNVTKESIQAIVKEFFDENNIDQKSFLSSENISGILAILSKNKYLKENFGFQIEVELKLVEEVLRKIKSKKGQGVQWLIDFASSLGLKMDSSARTSEDGITAKLVR